MDILALMRERAGDYDCPVCRRDLEGCELELMRDDDPQFTVQVSCPHCHVTFVVVLQVRHAGAETPDRGDRRRRRDRRERRLLAAERPVLPTAPPITADEVLDLHQALQRHSGPLSELFGATPSDPAR